MRIKKWKISRKISSKWKITSRIFWNLHEMHLLHCSCRTKFQQVYFVTFRDDLRHVKSYLYLCVRKWLHKSSAYFKMGSSREGMKISKYRKRLDGLSSSRVSSAIYLKQIKTHILYTKISMMALCETICHLNLSLSILWENISFRYCGASPCNV